MKQQLVSYSRFFRARAKLNLFDSVASAGGTVLLLLLVWRASGFIHSWDGSTFHLPYVAKIAGLCGAECFELAGPLAERYDYIPKFGHYLFAGIWMLAGDASFVGIANVIALGLFIVYLWYAFGVHWGLAIIALVTVPFVRIEASSMTVDLLSNSLVAIGVFGLLDYIINPRTFTVTRAAIIVAGLAAASATKLQVYPVAIVTWAVFILIVFYRHVQGISNGLQFAPKPWSRVAAVALCIVAMSIVSAWQIRNAVVYSNPIYPVKASLLGVDLPGSVGGRASLAEPHIGNHALVRWIASVVEYRAYDNRATPWVKSQGNVPHDSWSFRIGGFYGVYVLLVSFFIIYILRVRAERETRWKIGALLLGYTIMYMFLPASYYLRYNIWWILILVGVALVSISGNWAKARTIGTPERDLFRGVIIICCIASLAASGFRYVSPSGYWSVEEWVTERNYRKEVQKVMSSSDVICAKHPHAFYYASVFHPGSEHKTKQFTPLQYRDRDEGWSERNGCTYVVEPKFSDFLSDRLNQ